MVGVFINHFSRINRVGSIVAMFWVILKFGKFNALRIEMIKCSLGVGVASQLTERSLVTPEDNE